MKPKRTFIRTSKYHIKVQYVINKCVVDYYVDSWFSLMLYKLKYHGKIVSVTRNYKLEI